MDATANLDHKPIRLRVFDLPKMFGDFPIPSKKDYLRISQHLQWMLVFSR